MTAVTADLIVNHSMYAKKNIQGYSLPDTNSSVIYNFSPDQLIGNVFSWVTGSDGNIYWMFYKNNSDYTNQIATYVKHQAGYLNVPDLPAILAALDLADEKKQIAEKGYVAYYLDKYLPYIIIGAVVAIVLPTLSRQMQKK